MWEPDARRDFDEKTLQMLLDDELVLDREGDDPRPVVEVRIPLEEDEEGRQRVGRIAGDDDVRSRSPSSTRPQGESLKSKGRKRRSKPTKKRKTLLPETKTYKVIGFSDRGGVGDSSVKTKGWRTLRSLMLHPPPQAGARSGSSITSDDDDGAVKKRKKKRRRKRKKSKSMVKKGEQLNIEVSGVQFPMLHRGENEFDDGFEPPLDLSPRSRAQFARAALKRAAIRRRKKRMRKKELEKKRRKKRRRRKKKKKRESDESSIDDDDFERLNPTTGEDEHFYPTPRSLRRRRRAFIPVYKPVVCTICEGVHYRTKRDFASNLDILASVNASLGGVIADMGAAMGGIRGDLDAVKRNLQLMEDTYEGVFRKVNRLIA